MKWVLIVLSFCSCLNGPEWTPLRVERPDLERFDGDVDREHLLLAWQVATEVILERSKANKEDVQRLQGEIRIYVRDTPSWFNGQETVGGMQRGQLLIVGCDLAGLPHEFAHYVEWRHLKVDPVTAEDMKAIHTRWLTDGTQAAIDYYDTWNSRQSRVCREEVKP